MSDVKKILEVRFDVEHSYTEVGIVVSRSPIPREDGGVPRDFPIELMPLESETLANLQERVDLAGDSSSARFWRIRKSGSPDIEFPGLIRKNGHETKDGSIVFRMTCTQI